MPSTRAAVKDGVATGAVLALVVVAGGLLYGGDMATAGAWLFGAGIAISLASALWALAGYESPPGLLGVLSGSVEVFPTAHGRSPWLDRFVSARNVWLVAGGLLILLSLAPPFVGY